MDNKMDEKTVNGAIRIYKHTIFSRHAPSSCQYFFQTSCRRMLLELYLIHDKLFPWTVKFSFKILKTSTKNNEIIRPFILTNFSNLFEIHIEYIIILYTRKRGSQIWNSYHLSGDKW